MMKKRRVTSPGVPEPQEKLWSNCLQVGGVVYISGLTSRAADRVTIHGNDEYEQATIIFARMRSLMEAAGGSMDDIVKLTVYVTQIQNNQLVWKAREAFFSGDFPTCTLVEVSALATPDILVEINAVAHPGCA